MKTWRIVLLALVILAASMVASADAQRLSIRLDSPTPLPLGHFGESVAVGDVNGDTYADIVVGALYEGGGACGRVHVFFGPNGSTVKTLDMPVLQADARFGQSVAVGDVNGDTYADIVVGAPFEDVGLNTDQGRVYVFFGPNGTPLRTLDTPNLIYGRFGWSVAVGYVDAVAGADIVVGAPDEGGGASGRVYVFSGGFAGPLIHTLSSPNPEVGGQFGHSVAVGDVDADYRADIAVGAHYEDVGGRADEGRAYVFSGAYGLLLRTLQMPTGQAKAHFGNSVAVGYVNTDQNADIAVGTPDEDVGDNTDQGRAYVFSGAGSSPPLPPLFILDTPNPQTNGHFGFSAAVGDVNNDQNADIAVGAYGEGAYGVGPRAYVFSGDNGSLFRTLNNPSSQTDNQFGVSLAVGHVDDDNKINDGCPAVGAPETGAQCQNPVDDDADTKINDGCPAVGAPETGAQCNNALNDDEDAGGDIAVGAPTEAIGSNPDQGRAYVFSAEEPPPPATYYYDVTFEAASIIVGGEEKCVPSPCVFSGTAKVIRGNPYWSGGKQCADYHIESLTLTATLNGVPVEIRVGEGLTVPVSSGTTCEGTEGFDVTLSLYVEEWDEGASLASGGFTLQTDETKYCSCCIDCGTETERWPSIGCTAVVSEDPPDQITYDCGEGYDLCDCGTDEEKVWVGTPQTGGLLLTLVGGIAELPGATAGPDSLADSSAGSGFNYTALGAALGAAAVALAAGAWLTRRRWVR